MNSPNKNEHKRIARFLRKEFLQFCNKYDYTFNVDLTSFLIVLQNSYQKDQEEIAVRYGKKIKREVSQSKISREIDEINKKLKVFCNDFNIDPPIQMFSHYIDPINNKRTPYGIFLVCANSHKQNNTAQGIASFRTASPLSIPHSLNSCNWRV